MNESGRTATVVLVSGGAVLGALPAVSLTMPRWAESADVVAAVRQVHGIDVTILRLLTAPSIASGAAPSPTWPRPTSRHEVR